PQLSKQGKEASAREEICCKAMEKVKVASSGSGRNQGMGLSFSDVEGLSVAPSHGRHGPVNRLLPLPCEGRIPVLVVELFQGREQGVPEFGEQFFGYPPDPVFSPQIVQVRLRGRVAVRVVPLDHEQSQP